jgi:hypothetical protein
MIKYKHILWNNEEGHDKIWGIIQIGNDMDTREWSDPKYYSYENKYVTFWGRRGKSLQTKVWNGTPYGAESERDKKLKKGYKEIKSKEMNTVYPELEQDLEKTAVWAQLRS